MIIKAHSEARLHAKLRNEPIAELKGACGEARKELAAKLKIAISIELELASEAKLIGR